MPIPEQVSWQLFTWLCPGIDQPFSFPALAFLFPSLSRAFNPVASLQLQTPSLFGALFGRAKGQSEVQQLPIIPMPQRLGTRETPLQAIGRETLSLPRVSHAQPVRCNPCRDQTALSQELHITYPAHQIFTLQFTTVAKLQL